MRRYTHQLIITGSYTCLMGMQHTHHTQRGWFVFMYLKVKFKALLCQNRHIFTYSCYHELLTNWMLNEVTVFEMSKSSMIYFMCRAIEILLFVFWLFQIYIVWHHLWPARASWGRRGGGGGVLIETCDTI